MITNMALEHSSTQECSLDAGEAATAQGETSLWHRSGLKSVDITCFDGSKKNQRLGIQRMVSQEKNSIAQAIAAISIALGIRASAEPIVIWIWLRVKSCQNRL